MATSIMKRISDSNLFIFRKIGSTNDDKMKIVNGADLLRKREVPILCIQTDQYNNYVRIFILYSGRNTTESNYLKITAISGTAPTSPSIVDNDIVFDTANDWGAGYAIGFS